MGMTISQIMKKISYIDREILYYKKVYSGNIEKVQELRKKKRLYVRELKKQLASS